MVSVAEAVAEEATEVVALVVAVGIAFGLFHCAAQAGDQRVVAPTQDVGQGGKPLVLIGFSLDQRFDGGHGEAVEAGDHQQFADGEQLAVEEDVVGQGADLERGQEGQRGERGGVVEVGGIVGVVEQEVAQFGGVGVGAQLVDPVLDGGVGLRRQCHGDGKHQEYGQPAD